MKEYALVTGAGRGIGKCIAQVLAEAGYHLLLVSRTETDLQELGSDLTAKYGVEAHYFAADLTADGVPKQVSEWCLSRQVPIAILVNNAGYGLAGDFAEADLAGQLNMLRLNIDALVILSHHLLPELKKQRQGYILNVGSTAAYQAVPGLAAYSATKSFVLSFSRALRYELKNTAVSVSCLCPGPTDTDFVKRAGIDALAEVAARFNMPPLDVARTGIKGMFRKKAEIVPGLTNRLVAYATRIVPKFIVEEVAGRMYKR
ncbi:SDR family NAD(P)-dependent oxidoreductase [Hufsiella ginkgonis]|uniref:NADP-dependent 3-hydroxy acid dehydrogenase YdfG n=1 Tax=Hufsiella ginkgonis TaxID=2695274 RepID=A0A7K1Y0Y1_9SPHI|nr:SDR family oxidoreductase [Hufsiella ginkgonis]MXV16757.1 SDR family NAD(P)-dependent oxidoreductase [Hufsiella ginkgonis]